jgi:hypothetical protein
MNHLMTIGALAAGLSSLFHPAYADPSKPAVTIDPEQSCSRDLAALPEFLMANDAGAADNRRHRGEAATAAALERATRETASVKSGDDCVRVLRRYPDPP